MREMEYCKKSVSFDTEEPKTLVYHVTIDEMHVPASESIIETYGIGVTIFESGETALIQNVTLSKSRIMSLSGLLAAHLVTPVTVNDIVEDWLCSN